MSFLVFLLIKLQRLDNKIPAEGLGVKEYLPPYLDPSIQINDLLTGVCFASAGSGYDPQTTNQTRAIPMLDQLDLFKEYLGKLETNIGEEAAKEIITNNVFLVVASTNDMLFSLPASGLPDDVYDSMLVNLTLSFVQELYKLGARKIGVFSAPPVGCLPVERTLEGGLLRMCAENQNQQAQIFNNMLKGQLPILESNLPQSRIAFVDFYNPLISIINNPEQYGLEVTNRGCCGTGLIEFSYTCNQLVGTCPDDSKYLFFDSGHLSEIGCYIFANLTLPGLVENLF
uniref:SGNH hydrolase-type esterase domain-containing protein n=1 Tax=Lactuca sativa TaxID=4236 RepID=A0A9R1XSI2_LACSA|nr:hypothetical protein LSAT_V11C200052880 [Lactuca sativa]